MAKEGFQQQRLIQITMIVIPDPLQEYRVLDVADMTDEQGRVRPSALSDGLYDTADPAVAFYKQHITGLQLATQPFEVALD